MRWSAWCQLTVSTHTDRSSRQVLGTSPCTCPDKETAGSSTSSSSISTCTSAARSLVIRTSPGGGSLPKPLMDMCVRSVPYGESDAAWRRGQIPPHLMGCVPWQRWLGRMRNYRTRSGAYPSALTRQGRVIPYAWQHPRSRHIAPTAALPPWRPACFNFPSARAPGRIQRVIKANQSQVLSRDRCGSSHPHIHHAEFTATRRSLHPCRW